MPGGRHREWRRYQVAAWPHPRSDPLHAGLSPAASGWALVAPPHAGPIPVHRVIQLGKMHEAIAVGPGYLGIHEGDDLAGISDRLTGSIDGWAERAIAMLVRGRDLNERHIDGPGTAWHEEFGNSGQERRRITGTPG